MKAKNLTRFDIKNKDMVMMSWKYTTDFNKENHLFYQTINTQYIIEAFSCSCGKVDFIIKYQNQDIDYICPTCENETFYDANTALADTRNFIKKNNIINKNYQVEYSDNKVISKQILMIPSSINFLKEEIIFTEKILYIASLTKKGNILTNYLFLSKNQIKNLEDKIMKYIYNKNIFEIPKRTILINTLEDISIIMKKISLNKYNLNYINRSEKSIKRMIFRIFQQSNYFKQESYLKYIDIFVNDIKDPNILLKILDISNLKTHISLYNKNALLIKNSIKLLKQYEYTEKQIVKLLLTFNEEYMVEDTLNELKYIVDNKIQGFNKVSCTWEELHNEVIKCTEYHRHKVIFEKKLSYKEEETKLCIELNDYKIILPQSGAELIQWADILHNCMAGYFDEIQTNETIIYGFFKDDNLKFAVEICDSELIQASGKYNSQLEPQEEEVLSIWMKRFFSDKNDVRIAA